MYIYTDNEAPLSANIEYSVEETRLHERSLPMLNYMAMYSCKLNMIGGQKVPLRLLQYEISALYVQ